MFIYVKTYECVCVCVLFLEKHENSLGTVKTLQCFASSEYFDWFDVMVLCVPHHCHISRVETVPRQTAFSTKFILPFLLSFTVCLKLDRPVLYTCLVLWNVSKCPQTI